MLGHKKGRQNLPRKIDIWRTREAGRANTRIGEAWGTAAKAWGTGVRSTSEAQGTSGGTGEAGEYTRRSSESAEPAEKAKLEKIPGGPVNPGAPAVIRRSFVGLGLSIRARLA
jgi:hypothetical protein